MTKVKLRKTCPSNVTFHYSFNKYDTYMTVLNSNTYICYNCFFKILIAAYHKHRKDRSLLVKKSSAKICMNERI